MSVKVKEVWWGIANRTDNLILINKHLIHDPKFKEYADEVIEHELRHSSSYTLKDVKMDMIEGDFFKNLWFCLNHPSGFLQYVPISFHEKKILVDVTLIINYVLISVLIIFFITLIKTL